MSRLFESVEIQNKSWDDRVLESYSPRTLFRVLIAAVFVLGADVAAAAYELVRHHRFDWTLILILATLGANVFVCARIIYRRLERDSVSSQAAPPFC